MSPLAIPASSDALADVQARVLQVQQRIAAITGQPVASTTSTTGTGATTSRTFASALSRAQTALGTGAASGTAAGAVTGESIVADATQYLGVPYRWGGTDPDTGLDCSGLVQRVMADMGITVPRTAAQQATVGTEVPSLAQARPGDLVVLEGGHHIGIYVGDGKMIHAPKTGDVVKIGKVFETPMTIRRLVPDTATTAGAGSAAAYLRSAVLGASSGAASSTASGGSGAAAYQSLFTAATAKYGLPPGLLSAVAATESGYDADAVSPVGARGLMQLMPGTAADLGVDATDPAQAVDGAARLLSRHLDTFGSLPLALAAYNAGPGNVTRYGGVPPFAETQAYVRKVAAAMTRSA